ncbi:MAG: (2Fe-2S)-binding protein [Bacillota bacterium]|nr:(2Fe-2S)-binding protein [Bacillota bacterium]MDW7684489.1 (2Fe-2S)-binding protein [Bacillota bacterium]
MLRIAKHPVLTFKSKNEVTFIFEGKKYSGYEGEPIAVALHANKIKVLREEHRPRGLFCAIGNCSSCLMEVNGEPNVRVCVEKLRAGMVINMQTGKGKFLGGGNS